MYTKSTKKYCFVKRLLCLCAVSIVVVAVVPKSNPRAAELTLRHVVLSSAGVGYFEYTGEADAKDEARIELPLAQVDDVLKSMLISDPKGNPTVQLVSRGSLDEQFKKLPFKQNQLRTTQSLLNALRGAEIRVSGAEVFEGRVLRAVKEVIRLPNDGGTIDRHRVSVLSKSGIRQFVIEDVESVEFLDPKLKEQIEEALTTIADHRKQDRRELVVLLPGSGKRQIRLGYLISVPLWKVSYRLVTGALGKEKARLQGWAIIDNLSGRDWTNVSLSLTSGNPVTFRQHLYDAYYSSRPVAPLDVMGKIIPRLDEGTVASFDSVTGRKQGGVEKRVMRHAPKAALAKESAADIAPQSTLKMQQQAIGGPGQMVDASEALARVNYRFAQPQSLENGTSAMLTIIDRDIPSASGLLYQPQAHHRHPLAVTSVSNDGEESLPPGLVTIYQANETAAIDFIGDARLALLPKGEQRMLSYALDRRTIVDKEDRATKNILKGRISAGVLSLTVEDERETFYRIKTVVGEAGRLLIEHRRLAGWDLVWPNADRQEITEKFYRLAVITKPGETVIFPVRLKRTRIEKMQLRRLDDNRLVALLKNGRLSNDIRTVFEEIRLLRQNVDRSKRELDAISIQRQAIFQDQIRLRENLSRLNSTQKLHARYVDKLDQQETQLEALNAKEKEIGKQLEIAEKVLREYVATVQL